jgi:NADPH:quinone reductase-like Zn-dependent oxidoreductase
MKAYHIDRFGSVGGIVRRSRQDPRPGLNEILMRVLASSLNYRDLMALKGGGRGPTKIGVVPLSDGAGEVAAIGEGVTRVKIGDRIAGCFHPRWFGGPIKPDYLTDRLGDLHGVQLNVTTIIADQNHEQHVGIEHIAIETDDYRPTDRRL